MNDLVADIDTSGFAIVPACCGRDACDAIEAALPEPGDNGGLRNILDIPQIVELSDGAPLRALVEPILGPGAFPVRGILFAKTPAANWKVSWHQDLVIAVKHRLEVPGFGPWSEKAGIVHVQPPLAVLENMLAVRLHLDESHAANGSLRVLPGSHRLGRLRDADIVGWRSRITERLCVVPRGGVLLMRPLLLHASSPALTPSPRRVIHIEYSATALPDGLEWRWATRRARAA
jgi:hypothetical protein